VFNIYCKSILHSETTKYIIIISVAQCRGWDNESECAGKVSKAKVTQPLQLQ
jgi:hypothetical protein